MRIANGEWRNWESVGEIRERDIQARAFAFGVAVVRFVDRLPRSTSGSVISRQLARAGTSVGANLEEAQAAQSRKDFTRRIRIAQGEARESHYWLRLSREAFDAELEGLEALIQEANELVAILTSIARKLSEQ